MYEFIQRWSVALNQWRDSGYTTVQTTLNKHTTVDKPFVQVGFLKTFMKNVYTKWSGRKLQKASMELSPPWVVIECRANNNL